MKQMTDEQMYRLICQRVCDAFRKNPEERYVIVDFHDVLPNDGGPTSVRVEAGKWFGVSNVDEVCSELGVS
jgi:hypothetical protein